MQQPDDLLQMLADEVIPPPSATRKADTLLKANIAFRENMQAKAQRVGFFKRLFGIGSHTMERKMKMRTLMSGSALALVSVLVIGLSADYITKGSGTGQLTNMISNNSGGASFLSIAPLDESNGTPVPLQQSNAPQERARQLNDVIHNTGGQVTTLPSVSGIISGLVGRAEDAAPAKDMAAAPEYQRARPMQELSNETAARSIAIPAPGMPASPPAADYNYYSPPVSTDSFANLPDSELQNVAQSPVSTFSADVDTASYAAVRRMLRLGRLPTPDVVRTEEMVNYFNYNYALPEDRSKPFAPSVAVYPNPWHAGTQLVHIGIKAFDLPAEVRPPVNLVFLIDVSGSMDEPSKLPMVKSSFALLLDQLKPTDTVSIVTYAGNSGVALPPTKAAEREHILRVIQSLGAGGGTAGAEGLRTAYELALQNYNKEGVNRILLATDGDFNVGVSEPGGLAQYVASQRSSGIFLSVLGYGMGNYQDTTMQALAQNGNGVAAYIDDMSEARRVLSDQVTSTLFTVAKDVKFQVEFNPAAVQSYRLLGYETRALRQQDFNNDKVDAGEVGAGSEVTAIYEITPAGANQPTDSRYAAAPVVEDKSSATSNEIGFLRIRYKLPNSNTSSLIERPITQADRLESISNASADVRFSTAVAGFSRLLRYSQGVSNFGYGDVIRLAEGARGDDPNAERAQFIDLARTAQAVSGSLPAPAEDGGVAFPPPEPAQ